MGATGVVADEGLEDFKKSRSAIELFSNLRYLQRLFELTRVKELVKQLYHLLGAEVNNAHAGAHEALLDNRDALLKLGAIK